jgi:hypothetical protein
MDENDESVNGNILKANLEAAAKAGDPDNPNAKAHYANNVPALLEALREIMVTINNDIQPAKESMLEGDKLPDDDTTGFDPDAEVLNLYSGSFRINLFDQWEGQLTKYVTAKDKTTGAMVTRKDGELADSMLKRRNANPSSPRDLFFWNGGAGGNFAQVGFTGPSGAGSTTAHPLAELVGLGADAVASMDVSSIPGGSFTGKTHISRAMFDWYYGYDFSYIDAKYHNRRFMLADQGKSGIVKVGPSTVQEALDGYEKFAEGLAGAPTKLYVQTNDGVLHVVNPQTMQEEMGILPPPALLPRRAFKLKANLQPGGTYKWIDVNAFLANTSDDIPISSVPGYILDGALQVRHFNLGGNSEGAWDWRKFLFGSLGRGGAGLYSMNVTDPASPQFYWYRETIENDDGTLSLLRRAQGSDKPQGAVHDATPYRTTITRDGSYWTDLYDNPDGHAYEQLGFNGPKPYFSVARLSDASKYQNIIALAGGMQNRLDLEDNGTMGAALYLVDPDVQYHVGSSPTGGVRAFNSGSLKDVDDDWRIGSELRGDDPYMGMVNSEPVFLATINNTYIARGLFFADNRGSIFYVNFEDPDTGLPYDSWEDWEIRTVASLRLSGDNATASYSVPTGLMGGARKSSPNRLWMGGGTANAARADPPSEDEQQLANKSQMIFAFVMPDLADGHMTTRDDWSGLDPDDGASKIGDEDNGEGWYIPLRGAVPGQYKAEYVTTKPVLFGGNLYVATFREEIVGIGSQGACDTSALSGASRLYAISLESGKSVMWGGGGKKYLEFGGLKFTSFTVSEKGGVTTLAAAYQALDRPTAEQSANGAANAEESVSKVEGMDAIAIRMIPGSSGGNSNMAKDDGVVNYWRFVQ